MSVKEESKKYKVICPLINFQVQNVLVGRTEMSNEELMSFFKEREKELVEGIDLFDGVKIRRISKEDLEDLKSSLFPHPPETVVSPNMFVLEKCIIIEDNHDFQLHKTMQNIILAMRLLKKGYVSGNITFYILVSEKRQFTSVEWAWEEGRRSEPSGFIYSLRFDEIPDLKKIVEKIHGVDLAKQKGLHLAFKRFQRAYEEVDFEDQLVDFMIAFEALFLKGEKGVESISKKVANACSKLLGKNSEEIEEIRGLLTKAYSMRNSVVHGSEYQEPIVYKKKEYYMSEFVFKIEDYLRDSIRKKLD